MTASDPPLNLPGIARLLRVSFYRVRGWRMRGGKDDGTPRRYVLPEPDVSDLPKHPLWSRHLILTWAAENGLWPPKDERVCCPDCSGLYLPLPEGGVRPHWNNGVPCGGRLDRAKVSA